MLPLYLDKNDAIEKESNDLEEKVKFKKSNCRILFRGHYYRYANKAGMGLNVHVYTKNDTQNI